MKPSYVVSLATLLSILCLPLLAMAETRYITDVLVVSLRDNPSRTASILGHVRSGAPLEIIENNNDGYLLIKTAEGEQGWIQERYTTSNIPKKMR